MKKKYAAQDDEDRRLALEILGMSNEILWCLAEYGCLLSSRYTVVIVESQHFNEGRAVPVAVLSLDVNHTCCSCSGAKEMKLSSENAKSEINEAEENDDTTSVALRQRDYGQVRFDLRELEAEIRIVFFEF